MAYYTNKKCIMNKPVKCGQLVYGINGDELMTMRVIAALDNTFICLCVSDTHGVYRYSYADYGEKVFGALIF